MKKQMTFKMITAALATKGIFIGRSVMIGSVTDPEVAYEINDRGTYKIRRYADLQSMAVA